MMIVMASITFVMFLRILACLLLAFIGLTHFASGLWYKREARELEALGHDPRYLISPDLLPILVRRWRARPWYVKIFDWVWKTPDPWKVVGELERSKETAIEQEFKKAIRKSLR